MSLYVLISGMVEIGVCVETYGRIVGEIICLSWMSIYTIIVVAGRFIIILLTVIFY